LFIDVQARPRRLVRALAYLMVQKTGLEDRLDSFIIGRQRSHTSTNPTFVASSVHGFPLRCVWVGGKIAVSRWRWTVDARTDILEGVS
jgi:hypothetical protein